MLGGPVIALAAALVAQAGEAPPTAADAETPSAAVAETPVVRRAPPTTRRLLVPTRPKTKIEARAYMGEGIVDLHITRPAPAALGALQRQVGEIVERLEVFDDDADLLHVRLYTAVPYPQVQLTLAPRSGSALLDVTVHPHALTPREPIEPPVFAIDVRDVPLPLPRRTFRASSRFGMDVLERLDEGAYVDAVSMARRAIRRDEPAEFLTEVITEMHARERATALAKIDTLPVPDSASGKLMWIALALATGKEAEAEDVMRSLTRRDARRFGPYVSLYNAEIDRHLDRGTATPNQLVSLVRAGRRLPDGFALKACLLGAGALLERTDLDGARKVLAAHDDPRTRLWQAEAAYVMGDAKAAERGFRSVLADEQAGPFAQIRLIDLGRLGDLQLEERVLGELNLRAQGDRPAMLARARLLERGLLTKSFEATLASLGHLASVKDAPVALDAELRIGRLNSKSGNPAEAMRAFLRAETHATDRVSRQRARDFGQAAFVDAIEQLSRWHRSQALLGFADEFDEFMQGHPQRADLMTIVADAARRVGDTGHAVKLLIEVASMETGKVRHRVLAELVQTYLQAGDVPRARTVLDYADEAGAMATSPELSRARAETLRMSGQPERAVAAYVDAAKVASTATSRTENLSLAAEVALHHHLHDAARAALERMLRRERPSAAMANQARIDLATVHLFQGRAADAVGLLQRVRTGSVAEGTDAATVAAATYFEGEARWRTGDFEAAREVWASRSDADTEWDGLSKAAVDASAIAARLGSPTRGEE